VNTPWPLAYCKVSSRARGVVTLIFIIAAVPGLWPPTAYPRSNCILSPRSSIECSPGIVFTRSDFAIVAQRVFELPQPTPAVFFSDVSTDSPIYDPIQATAPFMDWHVLCPGCSLSSAFSPGVPISNAELAIALVRILVANGKVTLLSPEETQSVLMAFSDTADIPFSARPYIATALLTSIISGHVEPGGKRAIEPAVTYSRFEGVILLQRAGQRYGFPLCCNVHGDIP